MGKNLVDRVALGRREARSGSPHSRPNWLRSAWTSSLRRSRIPALAAKRATHTIAIVDVLDGRSCHGRPRCEPGPSGWERGGVDLHSGPGDSTGSAWSCRTRPRGPLGRPASGTQLEAPLRGARTEAGAHRLRLWECTCKFWRREARISSSLLSRQWHEGEQMRF